MESESWATVRATTTAAMAVEVTERERETNGAYISRAN